MLQLHVEINHPNPNAPIALTTDASAHAVGGVLEQFVDDRWQALGFYSKHLPADKRRWSTFRREMYAVQQSLRHFHTEIAGRHCVIFSDHMPLIQAFKNPDAQKHDAVAQNQLVEISQWTSDVRFIAGKSNVVSDWLSRPADVPIGTAYSLVDDKLDIEEIKRIDAIQNFAFETVDHKALAEAQASCPELERHLNGQHPRDINLQQVEFSPNVFLYCDIANGKKARPLVPDSWRQQIIAMFHDMSHPGQRATLDKVVSRYYWPSMRNDVANYIKNCNTCQLIKIHKPITPPLKNKPVPTASFSHLEIDVVGPLPVSEGMRYLLTVICRKTRWVDAIPMATATATSS